MQKSETSKLRILHISQGFGSLGGVMSFNLNYYKYFNRDFVKFDFLFCNKESLGVERNNPMLLDSKIFELNAYVKCHNRIKRAVYLIHNIKKIVKENGYKVVHIGTGSQQVQIICLIACVIAGVKIRISHSHSSGDLEKIDNSLKSNIKHYLIPINQWMIRKLATNYFACSYDAGKNLFGSKGISSNKFKIIHNAIEIKRFSFSEDSRRKIRNNFNVSDGTLVLGHVGRFDNAKNQIFLVKIFEQIQKINSDSQLWLIGDGETKESVEKYVKHLSYRDKIIFLGTTKFVNDYLQAFDVFILPSLYEGLSISAIEAQVSGLPLVISDNLSKEHNITGNVFFADLKRGPEEWAENIMNISSSFERRDCSEKLIKGGYDISKEAQNLERFYIEEYKT